MVWLMRPLQTVFALIFASAALLAQGAAAESLFEKLVMPGDLAAAHSKLQSNCQNCHTSFDKGTQPELCLNCHKTVAADVTVGTGFHGRSPEAKALACSTCHNDHQGVDFNLLPLDRETFDHALTDFALAGAHAATDCQSCHVAGKKFAQAPSGCIDCHKKIEPHKGALGTDCARCHSETHWAEVKAFDHSTTQFALVGAHLKLECNSCHVGEVWKGLPKTCVECHKIDDVHQGRFGADCESCHAPAKWVDVKFSHDRDTKFALTGKHKTADCAACHAAGTDPVKTPQDCIGCHRAEDVHKASLGTDCAGCHSTSNWRQEVKFDHGLTKMPLIGLHAVVPCEGCHIGKDFAAADVGCISCHAAKDVHKAALGPNCAACHTPNGWAFWKFDHDQQTKFALTGAHKGLTCNACHLAGTVPEKVSVVCASCHEKQDVHKGSFGVNCAACHKTSGFEGAKLQLAPGP